MGKIVGLALLAILVLAIAIALVPESPDVLYARCASNVQLPGYRALHNISVSEMDTYCDRKYPVR